MANKWLDTTEIVAGYVLLGKLDSHAVNPSDLHPPYHEIIPILNNGGSVEDVILKTDCGLSGVHDAKRAAESANGTTRPHGYLDMLVRLASRYRSGTELKNKAEQLINGDEVDLGKVLQITSQIDLGYRSLTPLSEVEPERGTWIKTGYEPLDEMVGGIPKAGLTLIAASPGVGKTTLALKISLAMLRKYKKKKLALFTLEMLMAQIVARYLDLDKSITKEERSRILASESAFTVGEIYALAARAAASENLCAIVIDFADLMVEGEQTEAVMGAIYRSLAVLAKQTRIPVILVCQLNRSTYAGGIPRINHIRYSGMAEMMASLILLLYNPNAIVADFKSDTQLIAAEGRGYIIVGKSRFGFKKGSPGAIQVAWDGEAGWGDKSYGWFSLTG